MTTTLYGIPNCDTVKKARAWLAAQGMAHRFHEHPAAIKRPVVEWADGRKTIGFDPDAWLLSAAR